MPTLTSTVPGNEPGRAAEEAGAWDEALGLYEAALQDARSRGNGRAEAQLLRTIGRVHTDRGDYDRARAAFEECLVLARSTGERTTCAAALNGLAAVAQLRGDIAVAESMYTRAGALAEELGDLRLGAMVQQNLGTLANTRGDRRSALERYGAALERFRDLEDDRAASCVLNNMGMVQADIGEWAAAELSFAAAYQLSERQADWIGQAQIEANRAELFLTRQQFERARDHCDRAFRIYTRLASHSGLADVHRLYGVLYRETGKPQVAHMQMALALRLARSCNSPLSEAETERERARLLLADGKFRPALVSLNRAYTLFAELEAHREILDLRRLLARLEQPYYEAVRLWTEQEPVFAAARSAVRGAAVGQLAADLVLELGMDTQLTAVRIGACLHDIGMAAVGRDLLVKPGPLTDAERELVRRHPAIGEQIARELHFPEDVRSIVRYHHERWDGGGYPDGLAGEQIPLAARIVCIADVFDALTTQRPFRGALTPADALAAMAEEAGAHFDPELFRVFREMINRPAGSRRLT